MVAQDVSNGSVFDVTGCDTIKKVNSSTKEMCPPSWQRGDCSSFRRRNSGTRQTIPSSGGALLTRNTRRHFGRRQKNLKSAHSELEEELGVVAAKMEKLSEFFVSPGFCEEKMWVYLATELLNRQRLDEDEVIEVVRLTLTEALEMISDGEIEDAKTIIGLMLAAPRIGSPLFESSYPAV